MNVSRTPRIALLSVCMAGCAAEPNPQPGHPEEPSYQAIRSEEIESERREFITSRRQQLSEVSDEITRLRQQLDASKSADEKRRAEWSNSLFELEQERDHLKAELDRAENASEEEWEAMRGDVAIGFDSLQAAATKLGNDIAALAKEPKLASDSGLCPVYVADVRTDVETNGKTIFVDIVTRDEEDVALLRERAHDLGQLKNYRPAAAADVPAPVGRGATGNAGTQAPTDAAPIPLKQVAVKNIEDGVRITMETSSEEQRERFLSAVTEDAKRLDAGDCAAPTSRPAASTTPSEARKDEE